MSEMIMMPHLWPEHVTVGDVVYPPGGVLGPRIQYSIELVMVHNGEMTVWIDGQCRYAPAGSVSILFPGHEERFAFSTQMDTYHSFVHLWLPDLPDEIERRLLRLPWPLPLSSAMHDLTRSALHLRRSSLSTADGLLRTLGLHMLWRYLGEGERLLAGEESGHPAVERARQFIQAHLSESLALADIAQAAAISPPHLIRLFRAEFDRTPIAYLWEQRVRQGIELLENTGLPVGLIAEQCGFQTSYHFSRRVRQATDLSPVEVRRRAWGQEPPHPPESTVQ
ncbi:MAG: AraC family transcriptional regulator [Anaerolineae bacterium]|nr:AraC family transcriptional regulator [Anaerolineae bacterium]